MNNDFSNINSEADLEKATQDISEKIAYSRQQIKKESRNLPRSVAREAIRKTAPWVMGAAAGLVATLLVRKLIRRSKPVPKAASLMSSATAAPVNSKIASAIAIQLLPIAGVLLKNWISKRRATNAVKHQH